MAAITLTFTSASAVPSPLYVVYQEMWGFSAGTLTVIFGVYAVSLLASLLLVGALSDHVGRRPVLFAAIFVEAVSLVLFLVANDVIVLSVARIVQGFATGAALATLGAALVDLQPASAPKRGGLVTGVTPMLGLAFGALGCGLLLQLAPAPTSLVFIILLVALAFSALAVWLAPETSLMKPEARSSLHPRVGLPQHLKKDMLSVAPILIASWALGGLYMSLGPSIAGELFGVDGHLVGGIVVFTLCGTGGLSAYLLRENDPQDLLILSSSFLVAGLAVTLGGLEFNSVWLSFAGTIVSGVGFGAAALAGFGTLAKVALAEERGEIFALAYVISYLAYSLPAVIGGFAANEFGLRSTTLVYGAAMLLLSVLAFFSGEYERRQRRTSAPA
ncbi:MAG: MFS transporter [Actinomycetota bacterium]|nr:MFS transporter [Actinomycetota bacterium]